MQLLLHLKGLGEFFRKKYAAHTKCSDMISVIHRLPYRDVSHLCDDLYQSPDGGERRFVAQMQGEL
jgi:hypothetical protein